MVTAPGIGKCGDDGEAPSLFGPRGDVRQSAVHGWPALGPGVRDFQADPLFRGGHGDTEVPAGYMAVGDRVGGQFGEHEQDVRRALGFAGEPVRVQPRGHPVACPVGTEARGGEQASVFSCGRLIDEFRFHAVTVPSRRYADQGGSRYRRPVYGAGTALYGRRAVTRSAREAGAVHGR
ncbi:hypothetical protein GCM10010301_18780 [Streptomyces plicatus]|nr:hypothetical protein GCM10010301_18780 [Streptomyces plicatus]